MMNKEAHIEIWGDPPVSLPIWGDPATHELAHELAFPKPIRDWWMRVAGGKCRLDVYDERGGWRECGKPAKEVHHVIPESWTLAQTYDDPNESVGLPLCQSQHTGMGKDGNGEYAPHGERNFSFHPDIGEARRSYHPKRNRHSFKRAVEKHIENAQDGVRFWGGDDGVDEHYIDKMRELAVRHVVEHPDDPKPSAKPHPLRKKREIW